ncbi:MAG: DISARM system SNF2-like helicase DrmD [Myxococcota bacterium]|jgi:superfamily II DNA or RNA helicase|nr:DISARM system SNF2-like helicase DrmD [Myxococcota bacterium]
MTKNVAFPREGMMATVRNRRALIARVKPHATDEGELHLVDLEYTDLDGGKNNDTVIWEREVGARLVEPGALPDVHAAPPMLPRDFDALIRASRWTALTPFLATDGSDTIAELPLASPFHGAVQLEDFQLEPLLRALRMPRISLLLADDVGLGKTIEAGLILSELLLRRRIRRVLIMAPAALRDQWQQEMLDKFALPFDLIDRAETHKLRRRLGLDANPWRTFPRIITSYHYLRQPDVLQDFMSSSRQRDDAVQLPWDLLIVDEAHNLMPAPFGEDSQLASMLRTISPLFEHKLFLTATPHNGHTRSFSGLLEQLDPVRFTRTPEFTEAEKQRVDEVLVRRLKRDINEQDEADGRQPRFPFRQLRKLHLDFAPRERTLAKAFALFRSAVKKAIGKQGRGAQLAGAFAVEVLNKRLLSCPSTFADSWYRYLDGTRDPNEAAQGELFAAQRASEEELADDLEKQDRARHAARTAGAWMKPLLGTLTDELDAVTAALEGLGLRPDSTAAPAYDARFEVLVGLIDERLREGRTWSDNERLIVFTEYKTTLDDLQSRLAERYRDPLANPERIRVLYGGLDPAERRAIKDAFNDPTDPVRVLLATDAASEGLNLQETARLLLHYEVPWNPSRLEQRNGRLDRHGQARDVTIHHFTSDDDADLQFLTRVVEKVEQIREDLGSLGELFDNAFQRRFVDLEDTDTVVSALDAGVQRARGTHRLAHRAPPLVGHGRVAKLANDLDLDANTLRDTLEVALGLELGQPRLEGPDARGRFRLLQPIPPGWQGVVRDNLRLPEDGSRLAGALPSLVFDADHFIDARHGRPVFRPTRDTALLHLAHPMFRHALATFARLRFPGAEERRAASRWLVRRGLVPKGANALLVVTVEELAVNALREPFHHWVRTLHFPVHGDELAQPLPYAPPSQDRQSLDAPSAADIANARELWEALAYDLRDTLAERANTLEQRITEVLAARRGEELARTEAAFASRTAEVRESMKRCSIKSLEKELAALYAERAQGFLFPELQREHEREIFNLEEVKARRLAHSEELLAQLQREHARVIERLLPHRFSLTGGGVQVYPLTVELRLPS